MTSSIVMFSHHGSFFYSCK
uniref:Uncharacterized protein n=1 Tax=Arundo donax TaxID=35708 RepID=A0A0A9CMD0_ARUDO